MFSVGASEKNIAIHYICDSSVPEEFVTDELRIK
jgi:hypothetical protein